MARRADWLTEVFPFYWQPQSNAEWLKQVLEGSAKRKAEGTHLRNLVQILEGSTCHDIELDVNPERVYYHAFEACLKGWYPVKDGEDRATLAEQFRQRLMTIMLANRRWTFADVDFNLNAPEPLSACDDDGWFRHSADPLEWLRGTKVPTYSTVRGFKIDATNGEVSIAAVPDSKGLVSFLDVMQLCRLAPDGVYFSLDPPDGDMSYHPFNLMRFGPSRMWSSLMVHTMFETDYILKSLTVGVEIQRIGNRVEEATEAAEAEVSEGGNAPDKGLYAMRDLRPLIESLPSPLKTAILDFHANERSQRALSRFWIESEPTPVSVEQRGSGVTYLLGDTPMRVKTEMMFRNELGKLEDAKDSDLPGWPITSVTPELWEKIVKRKWISPKIDAHGQLFSVGIGAVNGHYMEKYVFWQYGAPVASVIDSAFEQSANIRELSNIKKNMEGFDWSQEAGDLRNKAARTPEEHVAESKAEALIFKITCWAAEKTGMHHRFSAEYCLAMALTEHYALLERHFPVFARLRELSKLLAVVRLMNAVHEKANTDADLAPIRKSFDHFRLSKSRKIELDLSAECLWVPAQFRLSSTASAFRMVYGGVLASGSIYTRGAGGGQGGSSGGGDSGGGGGIKYTPINFINGRMYELQVRSILDQNGVYYREQVTTRTEDGIRKNDFVVLCAQTDRVLAVLECKSSDTARYPADQQLKDNYWRARGIPVYEVRPGTEQQILSSLPGSSTTGHLSQLPFFRSFRPK
ncbi:hypothetical protein AAVH_22845 [Aphelenchoides avenae]|nr:hypothetical protein AAVH_22845 [Aphelenchus avenae]